MERTVTQMCLPQAEVGFEPGNLIPEPARGTDIACPPMRGRTQVLHQLEEPLPLPFASSTEAPAPEVVCISVHLL